MAARKQAAAPKAAEPETPAGAVEDWSNTTSTAVVNYEEEMARQAEEAAKMERNAGGAQFFSVRGGQLTFDDMPVPGNQMAVVILASILENVYYPDAFDPENPTPPMCYAFGKDEAEMAPHEDVVLLAQAQNETCHGCPMNAWASADKGRGKACRNTRRLAVMAAGTIDQATNQFTPFKDVDQFKSGPIGYLKLPVTSVAGYATFVKSVAGALKRPPHGIFTRIRVVPDPKTQFRVLFEPMTEVPSGLLGTVMARHKEAESSIDFPYSLEQPVKKEEKPSAGKAAAKRTRGSKY